MQSGRASRLRIRTGDTTNERCRRDPNAAIEAVIFDLDNTLTDFMKAKENSIRAAVDAMIDAGLPLDARGGRRTDLRHLQGQGHRAPAGVQPLPGADHRAGWTTGCWPPAVVAYRRARDGSLVPYPHAKLVLNRLLKDGYKLAVVSDAPRFEAWLRLTALGLQHTFDLVLTFDDTGHHKPDPDGLPDGPGQAGGRRRTRRWSSATGRNGTSSAAATPGCTRSTPATATSTPSTRTRSTASRPEPDFVVDDLLQLLDVLDQLNGVDHRERNLRCGSARPAQMAAIDRETIAGGVPGAELMERAGQAMAEVLLDSWRSRQTDGHQHAAAAMRARPRRRGADGPAGPDPLRQGQQRRRRPGHGPPAGRGRIARSTVMLLAEPGRR